MDGIPVLAHAPARGNGRLVVWVPYLGGTKETFAPLLARFAVAGFVAVGVDPRQHGARATSSPQTLLEVVMGRFRETMWLILGGTVLDTLEVIDWALHHYQLNPEGVVVGGVSMGGDVAVAAAGADLRIGRVAAIAATPDWTRPGMTRMGEPGTRINQGTPGGYGRWLYERLDPLTHLDAYRHVPAIRFDVGGVDTHVPPDGVRRFQALLAGRHPAAGARVTIVEHAGCDHLDVATDPAVLAAAAAWLIGPGLES